MYKLHTYIEQIQFRISLIMCTARLIFKMAAGKVHLHLHHQSSNDSSEIMPVGLPRDIAAFITACLLAGALTFNSFLWNA